MRGNTCLYTIAPNGTYKERAKLDCRLGGGAEPNINTCAQVGFRKASTQPTARYVEWLHLLVRN